MRRLVKYLLGLVAVIVVVAVALVVFVSTADFGAYRTEIADAVEAATGRKVTIKGKIDQEILTLSPSIVLNDVTFANAKWGRRPEMVTAKRIEIALDLIPLLSGEFHVRRFTLVGADVLLETNAKGQGNWAFWSKEKRAETLAKKGKSPATAAIQNLHIKDSLFTFYDGRSRLVSRVHIDEISATAASLDSPLSLRTKGTYNDVPIETEGKLGAFGDFLRSDKDYPVDLRVRFGKSDLKLAIKSDLSGRLPSFDGTVTSERLDIDQIAKATGRAEKAKKTKPKDAARTVRQPGGELPLGILGLFNAKLDVKVATLVAGGNPFRDVGAKVALTDGDLKVTDLAAKLTNGEVKGNLSIDVRTDQPKVAVDLKATKISLAQVTRNAVGRPVLTSMASATAKLNGHGRSVDAITRSLSGPVAVYIGGGPINQGLFRIASTDVLSLFGLSSRGAFRVICGVFPLHFRNGVGYGRNLVLDTTRVTLYGRGAINLPRRYIDMVVVPAGKGVSLTKVVGLVPFRVRGPLTRPSVAPDPKGVPTEVVKGILGAISLPGDIAGSLFGRGSQTHRRGCGARKDISNGGILKKPGELLKKPGKVLKKLLPFR
jgi:uncharacterized protein involved in outer membrane biogenesis